MENGRYTNTLGNVPASIVEIKEVGVPMGLLRPRIADGFQLVNGTVVLEDMRDENGYYIGGAGMDGMYMRTNELYEPCFDGEDFINAFRQMNQHTARFNAAEQAVIAQYAMNTKQHLLEDLRKQSASVSPELEAVLDDTINKLESIPDEECRKLMADLYSVYRQRSLRNLCHHTTDENDR